MAMIPLFTETTNTVFINPPCINAYTNRECQYEISIRVCF